MITLHPQEFQQRAWETTIRVIILPSSGDDLWQQQHVCSI